VFSVIDKMNSFMLRSLLIVAVLFSIFQDGLCRKCYQCDSFTNPGEYCGELYDINTTGVAIKECDSSEDYCITNGVDADGVIKVKRDCFNLSGCSEKITVITSCRVCKADLCNGNKNNSSSINLPSIILGIVGFILVRFYININ